MPPLPATGALLPVSGSLQLLNTASAANRLNAAQWRVPDSVVLARRLVNCFMLMPLNALARRTLSLTTYTGTQHLDDWR